MHTPRGCYSSALNHTNHEREQAGMDSQALWKRVYQRTRASKNSDTSPDLFYCMNRMHPDGSPVENPYLDTSSPVYGTVQNTGQRMPIAGRGVNPVGGGRAGDGFALGKHDGGGIQNIGSGLGNRRKNYDKTPSGGGSNASRSERTRAKQAGYDAHNTTAMRLTASNKREEVPSWPRDWGRKQDITRTFEIVGVGEIAKRRDPREFNSPGGPTGARSPRSERTVSQAGSYVSGKDSRSARRPATAPTQQNRRSPRQ